MAKKWGPVVLSSHTCVSGASVASEFRKYIKKQSKYLKDAQDLLLILQPVHWHMLRKKWCLLYMFSCSTNTLKLTNLRV